MAYSLDFRRHVLFVRERDCLTIEETSERFSVGVASIVRWLKDPVPKATRERAAKFGVSQNTICNALRKLNLTHKKSDAPSESG